MIDPNMHWLFYAYGVGWLLIFFYLFQLGRREHELQKKVSELQAAMEEKWKRGGERPTARQG